MRCNDIANFHVERARGTDTVQRAAQRMREGNIGFLPVCDALDRPLGTITDRDITLRVVADGLSPATNVASVMTTGVVTCGITDDISVAELRMAVHKVARVLCCDDTGAVVAVLSLTDIAQKENRQTTGRIVAEVTSREARRS